MRRSMEEDAQNSAHRLRLMALHLDMILIRRSPCAFAPLDVYVCAPPIAVPDPKEGYQLAEISDIREGSFAVVRLVRVRAPLPVPPPLCLPLILFFFPRPLLTDRTRPARRRCSRWTRRSRLTARMTRRACTTATTRRWCTSTPRRCSTTCACASSRTRSTYVHWGGQTRQGMGLQAGQGMGL